MGVRFPDGSGKCRNKKNGNKVSVPCSRVVGDTITIQI